MIRSAIILLLMASNCYAIEKLEVDGNVRVTILSPELVEVTAESGTAVYDEYGNISQVIF